MERNLRLYPYYQGFQNLLFWMPVFFLYFSAHFTPARVLQLEAIYYFAVVLLEVLSGYFSDRVGRRGTLMIAAGAWSVAGTLFAIGGAFGVFVTAQVLLAAGMAFNSGTDTSLLFESLEALGREEEIDAHESRAVAWGFGAAAASAILGGLVAGFDFRLAYVLSAGAAVGALAVAWRFREPPEDGVSILPPWPQVRRCAEQLRNPAIAWVFLFALAMTVFNHIPYEFSQPWLDLLIAERGGAFDLTPPVSGALAAVVALLAAVVGRRAAIVRRRIGSLTVMLAAMALQGLVILPWRFSSTRQS